MSRRSTKLLKAALAAVHHSGAENVLAPFTKGAGHQVRPDPPQDFAPSRIVRVTPDFLDAVVGSTLEAGFDVIPLDEIPDRLARGSDRAFALLSAR
jgi:hypothetical protein